MARTLRIVVSVFFGVLTVALCVLWVRSKARVTEMYFGSSPYRVSIASADGLCGIAFTPDSGPVPHSGPLTDEMKEELAKRNPYGFGWARSPHVGFIIPFWLLTILSGFTAAGIHHKHLSRQFSLRTLLIATTLVAVVLGLAVWAVR